MVPNLLNIYNQFALDIIKMLMTQITEQEHTIDELKAQLAMIHKT